MINSAVNVEDSKGKGAGTDKAWQAIQPGIAWVLALAAMIAVLAMSSRIPPRGVGDGAEYYAMFFAWRDTWLPFMTERSWQSYAAFVAGGSTPDLRQAVDLKGLFPALAQASGADFNHFWFYSLMASLAGKMLPLLSDNADPNRSFALLHGMLAGASILLAARRAGWPGIGAVAFIYLTSPALWYFDKVHTEFFTISLSTVFTISIASRSFLVAAIAAAAASTQNPSFAAVAFFALGLWTWNLRGGSASVRQATVALSAFLLCMLHPVYYYFRWGFPTPQLVIGGADLGNAKLATSLLWFLDPDVGLLPNWPVGLVSIGIALLIPAARRSIPRLGAAGWSAAAAFVLFSAIAQSTTQNLNSGASVYVSRYSTWYIGLFFIPLLATVRWAVAARQSQPRAQIVARTLFGILMAAMSAVTMRIYWPASVQNYLTPTWASFEIQRNAPWLYMPPAEVFVERFGENEGDGRIDAVVGPDCQTVLVRKFPLDPNSVVRSGYCGYPIAIGRLVQLINDASLPTGPARNGWSRLSVPILEKAALSALPPNEPLAINSTSPWRQLLGRGWHVVEPWGVWSRATSAELFLPLGQGQGKPRSIALSLTGFVRNEDTIVVRIVSGERLLKTLQFQGPEPRPQSVSLDPNEALDADAVDNVIRLRFETDRPRTPSEYGFPDGRLLGVALTSVTITQ